MYKTVIKIGSRKTKHKIWMGSPIIKADSSISTLISWHKHFISIFLLHLYIFLIDELDLIPNQPIFLLNTRHNALNIVTNYNLLLL